MGQFEEHRYVRTDVCPYIDDARCDRKVNEIEYGGLCLRKYMICPKYLDVLLADAKDRLPKEWKRAEQQIRQLLTMGERPVSAVQP